jgi:hypothetical protein
MRYHPCEFGGDFVIKAVQVEALPGHRIRIRFEDGTEGVADLDRFAGRGVFRIWEEEGAFERVRIGPRGEIEWSDEVAICPDALYLEISGKAVEEIFPNAKETSVGA